jgi:hypothetical protein
MGGRTLYCATKLLSVVRGYLQSNIRLVSGEALPSLLLRAALQLQNGRVATAQGSGQHHVALNKHLNTIKPTTSSWLQALRVYLRRSLKVDGVIVRCLTTHGG